MSEAKFDWKEFAKKIGKALLDVLKTIDWKALLIPMLKDAYINIRPTIAKKVNDSASKWDDVAFEWIDKLVCKFLDIDEDKLDARKDLIEANK